MTARILCIEDEEVIRTDIVHELREAGYDTFEAENGKAGLAAIRNIKPDLVISDVAMPMMSGFEVLREIRADHRDIADTPFLFLTSLADRDSIITGKSLGSDDYLTKPIDFEYLLAIVKARLSRAAQISARKEREIESRDNRIAEAEKFIRDIRSSDLLTGLQNRTAMIEQLQKDLVTARSHNSSITILLLDVDEMADVNDAYGYLAGNKLLKTVGDRLRSTINLNNRIRVGRDKEGMLSRFGDDEFLICLSEGTEVDEAIGLAESITSGMSAPLLIEGRKLFPSISIGIATSTEKCFDIAALLKRADIALRQSKSHGHNSYRLYDECWAVQVEEGAALKRELRGALERQDFVLYYQPRIEARSGRVAGVEALIRWQHPERGMVSPATFIPVVEATDMIIPLGEWVLRAACQQIKSWRAGGLGQIEVAVNLSSPQFKDPNFVGMVSGIVEETGIDPTWLELEITESVFLEDEEMIVNKINLLREMGIGFAIDDFGTGYSSLAYLKRLPTDILKIDRTFVREILENPQDAAISGAIIEVGHAHGMRVVAEGIETVEQLEFLRLIACDQFQGFYFSPPMPAKDFPGFLEVYDADWIGKGSAA